MAGLMEWLFAKEGWHGQRMIVPSPSRAVEKDGFNEHVRMHDGLNTDKGTDLLLEDTKHDDVPTSLDELSDKKTDVRVEQSDAAAK